VTVGKPALTLNGNIDGKGKTVTKRLESAPPMIYEIIIEGRLSERWIDWFEGLTFTYNSDDTTTLYGPLADQSALHGILNHIRDLGLELISAQRIDDGPHR
jgi:hypothetical protein